MRTDVVALILGWISLLLIIPLTFSMLMTILLDSFELAIQAFLLPIILSGGFGFILLNYFVRLDTQERLRDKEAFSAVALAWPVIVFFGALPFWLSGVFHGPFTDSSFIDMCRGGVNSWFESMSGFTTTGSTVIAWQMSPNCVSSTVDCIYAQPRGLLLWRSITQWLGGMGIIMLGMVLFARILGGGMSLARAELTGPSLARLRPRLQNTAMMLWGIYICLTIFEMLLLNIFGKMDAFDSINHALTTLPTGGFSTRDGSIGHYDSIAVEGIVIGFMFLAGINFSILSFIVFDRNLKKAFSDEEARNYILILVTATIAVTLSLWFAGWAGGKAFRDSIFQIVSIGTSTGYGSADYVAQGNSWPTFTLLILFFLMVIGASAGSTGGGLKVLRFNLSFKVAWRELSRITNPRQVKPIRMNGEVIEEDYISLVVGLLIVWIALFVSSTLILALFMPSHDVETIASVVASALGNTGPALGAYGPSNTWASMNSGALIWTSLLMWLGRLELLTVLILLHRKTWARDERDSSGGGRSARKSFRLLLKREDKDESN
ncbi:MAG: TrkH family potassium uptake protein [Euryarchaeota archaeon]|jgi:trk system potassium uptake protein|nr:TrkH family potassium uptake protein [Euryarchaeota archaeon]MBT3971144.1 TrkH family potassium uptake protein [Euryarchaeota archaeon]MBT4407242.1 TrkH family potassium uptake protein [Euryarchaeota archaeon]